MKKLMLLSAVTLLMTGCVSPVGHLTDEQLCSELGYGNYDENILVDEYRHRRFLGTITLTEDQCVRYANLAHNAHIDMKQNKENK